MLQLYEKFEPIPFFHTKPVDENNNNNKHPVITVYSEVVGIKSAQNKMAGNLAPNRIEILEFLDCNQGVVGGLKVRRRKEFVKTESNR